MLQGAYNDFPLSSCRDCEITDSGKLQHLADQGLHPTIANHCISNYTTDSNMTPCVRYRFSSRGLLEICVFVCWLCFGTTFIDAQPQVTSFSPMNSPATGGGVSLPLLIEGSRFGTVKALVFLLAHSSQPK
jgi:hypothetical protein